ncbi:hypothetical protein [Chryseobacterium sp. SIMBA_038]|uniref:hypothetical protein n=1 Tax=Chryseobacterium sp. SIMBA_038 TaxID=3085780 RepID=UPI00397E2C70
MSNLDYPHSIDEVDNKAPFTLIYDEYDRFQICHVRLGDDMNFVVLIRILDSKIDTDGTITLNGFDLMVIHSFFREEADQWIVLDTDDIINNPPVKVFHSDDDEKHHKISLVNFKVRIKLTAPIPLTDPIPFYYYSRPVKIRTGEKLHFVMEGLGEEFDMGASQGRMCLVDSPVGKRLVTYEEYLKITGG